MSKVSLVEMALRDGLQNEAVHLSVSQRFRLLKKLCETGLKRIEIGAFVSPRWVPQMSETGKLVKKSIQAKKEKKIKSDIRFSTLVPNMQGFTNAKTSGIREIAVFGSASETFSKKNINCSIKQSLKTFHDVILAAKKDRFKIRAYLSTVFACPYEGRIPKSKVLKLIEKYLDMGIHEISLGDTIGVASPKQVRQLLIEVLKITKASKVALHFHDTRGTAIANIVTSLDLGFYTFDPSLGGLGGCPYAPGSAGNVATEDVLYTLHEMGFKTGLDLEKLIKTTHWMSQQLGRPLNSKLSLTNFPNKSLHW